MVREALFSILGSRTVGARFLDLYAGSGAVGLEAWSRGAGFVHWVELDVRTLPILNNNVHKLCDSKTRISRCEALRFLKKKLVANEFDIIFADPPYNSKEKKSGVLIELLNALSISVAPGAGGLFIMQQGKDESLPDHTGWKLLDDRAYGSTRLMFFGKQ